MKCPCCGGEIADVPVEALKEIDLRAYNAAILRLLVAAYPRALTIETLIEGVYAGNEPEHAVSSLRVLLKRLRAVLEPYGWTITGGRGKGRPKAWNNTPLYRLVKLK